MLENDADIRWDILVSRRDRATRLQIRAYRTRFFRSSFYEPSQEEKDYFARFDAAESAFIKAYTGKYA